MQQQAYWGSVSIHIPGQDLHSIVIPLKAVVQVIPPKGFSKQKKELKSPVTLSWKPMPGDDVVYRYSVKYRGKKGQEYARKDVATEECSVSLDLPRLKPDEFYEFTVDAFWHGKKVGSSSFSESGPSTLRIPDRYRKRSFYFKIIR